MTVHTTKIQAIHSAVRETLRNMPSKNTMQDFLLDIFSPTGNPRPKPGEIIIKEELHGQGIAHIGVMQPQQPYKCVTIDGFGASIKTFDGSSLVASDKNIPFNEDPINLTIFNLLGRSRNIVFNQYQYMDVILNSFFKLVFGRNLEEMNSGGIVACHGDKTYGYRNEWAKAGVPFNRGTAIYMLSHFSCEFVEYERHKVSEWVIEKYHHYLPMLIQAELNSGYAYPTTRNDVVMDWVGDKICGSESDALMRVLTAFGIEPSRHNNDKKNIERVDNMSDELLETFKNSPNWKSCPEYVQFTGEDDFIERELAAFYNEPSDTFLVVSRFVR